jgi:hypothetical protein
MLGALHRMERKLTARMDALEAALHVGTSKPLLPEHLGPTVRADSASPKRGA